MDVESAHVWQAVGSDGFVPVEENGSRLVTIELLCTLQEADDGVCSRFFRKEYYCSWKIFSHHFQFNARLMISLEKACRGFNCHDFWGLISGQVVHGKCAPWYNEIRNPTLHLTHKSVAITLFPMDDVRTVHNDKLIL